MKELLNKIHHADCLEFMKQLPDKCVDLVLTDPPYGIGADKKNAHSCIRDNDNWKKTEWDLQRPEREVFDEIQRISKNQIIWGGNYFSDYLPASQGWLFWDKGVRDFSLADGELAFTSFAKSIRVFEYHRATAAQDGKIHPTQKPLQLFKWCLSYAKLEKGIVLDCFSGSGTTALACHDLGLDFICIEKDADYHAASVKRLEQHQRQLRLL
jgi:site-specific DNA-methyltransferase (adenine-specific)